MAHVSDVLHVAHPITQVLQITVHHIKSDVHLSVPYVSMAVGRGSAYIHPHKSLVDWHEGFLAARQIIVYSQGHNHYLHIYERWAKIIRPAAVCSTLVTTASTVRFRKRLPFSTTTIVPSSR